MKVKILNLIKITPIITPKKIIFIISAKKNIPNPPLEYSTLKPLTNSLSPSAKSKGARCVSETAVIKNSKKELTKPTTNIDEVIQVVKP